MGIHWPDASSQLFWMFVDSICRTCSYQYMFAACNIEPMSSLVSYLPSRLGTFPVVHKSEEARQHESMDVLRRDCWLPSSGWTMLLES